MFDFYIQILQLKKIEVTSEKSQVYRFFIILDYFFVVIFT